MSSSSSMTGRIQKLISNLPNSQRYINRTTYARVKDDPIAFSIENETAIGFIKEVRCQLGLWVAAWHQRMSALAPIRGNQQIVALHMRFS
jgi:hypothetical protein